MTNNNNSNIPWVEKYRPKSIKEMALPTAKLKRQKVDLAEELKKFITQFFKEREKINEINRKIRQYNRTTPEKKQKEEKNIDPSKAAVLLEGQPGIGKTSIVYALANDMNMQVVETNASDTRTRDTLEAKLKETSKSRGIMDFITQKRKKLILIDEVDGIYGNADRGAVPAIIDLVKSTQFPIIMCANEYKSSLQTVYKLVPKFEVHPLSKEEITRILKRILKNEGIKNFKPEIFESLIIKNEGDLRGIINDLQGIAQGSTDGDFEILTQLHRDSTEQIFELIRDLFQKVSSLREARDLTNKSDVDYNFLYKWINENLPTFISINQEIEEAYENLSIADEIFGRIRRNMEWSLLPYFYDLFAGGVVLAAKRSSTKGFRRITFPRYTSSYSMSLNKAEEGIVEKVKDIYEISDTQAVRDFIPFLKLLTSSSRRTLIEVSEWLDLSAKEKSALK
ncbi:MAG: Replication factor C large subunit (modular protein) [Promethearchaeota archaeon]|nr:MAG: Replication factor C large subunit (modular protein) [Candidatus Lokiarchaeota archaeon]